MSRTGRLNLGVVTFLYPPNGRVGGLRNQTKILQFFKWPLLENIGI